MFQYLVKPCSAVFDPPLTLQIRKTNSALAFAEQKTQRDKTIASVASDLFKNMVYSFGKGWEALLRAGRLRVHGGLTATEPLSY